MNTHDTALSPQLISIVAPMWNEQENVDELMTRLQCAMGRVPDARFEVIVVDDGSTDATRRLLAQWQGRLPELRILGLSRNFGHQAALSAGLDHACGDAVILMDADLQDPPELITELVKAWRGGADVAYAVRSHRDGEAWLKRATAFLFYRGLRWLSQAPIPVDTGDYRIMSRRVVQALANLPERDRYLRGLVAWVGFTQVPVPFVRERRHAGNSRYSWGRMVGLGVGGLVSFTDRPLLAALGAGFITMLISLMCATGLMGLVMAGRADVVPGWSSLVVLIIFLAAVQLISLGVIGLYISRLFIETKSRPLYFVSHDSRQSDGDAGSGTSSASPG